MVVLNTTRYAAHIYRECYSVEEAAAIALYELDADASFPKKITENHSTVWEFKDLTTFRGELEKIAGDKYNEHI